MEAPVLCTNGTMGEASRRVCVFCKNGPVTREHVWPDWVSDAVGARFGKRVKWSMEGSDRNQSHGSLDAVVKRVCKPCNSGWMSALETQASALLTPFILGDMASALISRKQQELLSVWATKTLLMADFLYATQQYPRKAYSRFYAAKLPPERSVMWVAAFGGTRLELHLNIHTVHFTASNYPDRFGIRSTANVRAVVGTLTLARLVIQQLLYVDGPDDLPLPRDTAPDGIVTERVWPLRAAPVKWPPGGRAMDSDALAAFVIRSGNLDIITRLG